MQYLSKGIQSNVHGAIEYLNGMSKLARESVFQIVSSSTDYQVLVFRCDHFIPFERLAEELNLTTTWTGPRP
jgi:hypothetical protein